MATLTRIEDAVEAAGYSRRLLRICKLGNQTDFIICHSSIRNGPDSLLSELNRPGVKRGCFIRAAIVDSDGNVKIELERSQLFSEVVQSAIESERFFCGSLEHKTRKIAIVAWSVRWKEREDGRFPLECLRTMIIGKHIRNICQSLGWICTLIGVDCDCLDDFDNWSKRLDCMPDRLVKFPSPQKDDHFTRAILKKIVSCGFCSMAVDSDQNETTVNLGDYVKKENPDGGYDKSIREVTLCANGKLSDLVLNVTLLENLFDSDSTESLIHLAPEKCKITVEKTSLLWKMFSKNSAARHQQFVFHGGVSFPDGKDISISELCRTRERQFEEASATKYGESTENVSAKNIIRTLTSATIKYDFISKSIEAPVKVRLDSEKRTDTSADRAGAFIVYNYARLCTLLENFSTAVKKEIYEPLGEVSQADFTLLLDDGEWDILFRGLCQYHLAVKDVEKNLEKNLVSQATSLSLQLNKVSLYAFAMVQKFSSYYGRVRILSADKPHLRPLMHARLHLIISVRMILEHFLRLLNIRPLEHI
ncbi:DALR anticodon-binding domain-containing protein 3-like isoform X2 [Oscarella lobularis]|uniref:DALR anticodon-binding domain-containing protein 3-like isoform X2 n=1 Tax=Oscarella lobularis TaxID=121494 RepID=UPI0033144908